MESESLSTTLFGKNELKFTTTSPVLEGAATVVVPTHRRPRCPGDSRFVPRRICAHDSDHEELPSSTVNLSSARSTGPTQLLRSKRMKLCASTCARRARCWSLWS